MIEERSKLDEDIKAFLYELKRCLTKDEIEEIAREIGFGKKGKIKACEFVFKNTIFLSLRYYNNSE